MPCCKVSIKNTLSEKVQWICIPTRGKDYICVCKNEEGKIVPCFDCKAIKTDDNNYRCVNSSCICIPTDGKTCLSVCETEEGIESYDCSCKNMDQCKENDCGGDSKADPKCGKLECVCILTEGKPYICVCKNKTGEIVRCDNCRCEDTENTCKDSDSNCKCKCNKDQCVCIPTKGKSCICVCKNKKGIIVSCDDCHCEDTENTWKDIDSNCKCQCNKDRCVCIPTEGKSCICIRKNPEGILVRCDDCPCEDTENICKDSDSNCKCQCNKDQCVCISTEGKSCICVCKKTEGILVRCDDCHCEYTDNTCKDSNCKCKCNKDQCLCIPTEGKSCICVRKNKEGLLVRCDDCLCENTENPCKDNDSNFRCKCSKDQCVCIPTEGKSCICVRKNKEGLLVRCDDCHCENTENPCKDNDSNFKCKCNKDQCVCIQTEGKSCIFVRKNKVGKTIRCDDCQCEPIKKTNVREPCTCDDKE